MQVFLDAGDGVTDIVDVHDLRDYCSLLVQMPTQNK